MRIGNGDPEWSSVIVANGGISRSVHTADTTGARTSRTGLPASTTRVDWPTYPDKSGPLSVMKHLALGVRPAHVS